ncbi:hypothetical protein Hanom_Chr17g01574471 [Helianthus anomalus]
MSAGTPAPSTSSKPPKTHRAPSFPFTGDFSVTHYHPPFPRLPTTSPYNHLPPLFFRRRWR